MPIEEARIMLLASGATMLCLATCIFALNPGRTFHRALGALLAVRGLAVLLPQASSDQAWVWTAANLQPAFALAVVPIALYCATLDPRPGARPGRFGWWTLAAVGVLEALYWIDHTLFQTLVPGEATGALRAANGVQYAAFGPLAAVGAAAGLALACAGLRFAVHYRQHPSGQNGTLILLLAAGFLVGALFDGGSRLAALADLLDAPGTYPWLPWGWTVMVLPALALAPALLGLVVLVSGEARPHRRIEIRLVAIGAIALGAGLLRLALPPNSDPAGDAAQLVLAGIARLLMPMLVGAAMLPHEGGFGTRVQEAFAWSIMLGSVAIAGLGVAILAAGRIDTPAPLAAAVGAAVAATLAMPLLGAGRAVGRWATPRRRVEFVRRAPPPQRGPGAWGRL